MTMKNKTMQTLVLSVLAVTFGAWTSAFAQSNTAYGHDALESDTTGAVNSAFGEFALNANTSGSENTAAGAQALEFNTTGQDNTAFGFDALESNTTGTGNSAFGPWALQINFTSSYNSAFGYAALYNDTAGDNTASGAWALYGSYSCCNVADGYQALEYVTSGQANTGVGNVAGKTADSSGITGKNNTFLGTGTVLGTGTLTNATALGANAEVDASNSLVLGSVNGKNGQTVTVKVGIGTTEPDSNLTVNGSADKPGGGSWGTYSDGRLKTLDGGFHSGLSQILKLNPVRYRYKEDNAMGIRDRDEHVGLVAQEVQKVIPEAVTENNSGYLLVNNDPIVWAMLNSIKEQQRLIAKQQREIDELETQLKTIRVSLKTSGRDAELRRVKAQVPAVQQ
jgi:Chaperone of endosialidase